jgi:hypothetical protein
LRAALVGPRAHADTAGALPPPDAGEPLAVLRREGGGQHAQWSLHFRFRSSGALRANMPVELPPTTDRALGWACEELAALLADHWVLGEEPPLPVCRWDEAQSPRDPAPAAAGA